MTAFTSQINGGKAMTPALSGPSIWLQSYAVVFQAIENHTTKIGNRCSRVTHSSLKN
jgi:hypothetical protein